MFDEICSIYAHATDNKGKFVDMETGELIQQMTIREFCLTDRWKPYVQKLRSMVAEFGASKAKKMPEYIDTKKQLPGATPSGLFALWEDDCLSQDNRKYRDVVSRRETHLHQHTGWLVIDIDLGDNASLSNFNNIRVILEDRPEVALLMRSCSGTGFFGLVHLAHPAFHPADGERYSLEEVITWHKAQFRALCKEYISLGVKLDPACSNIGRVRFASWDEPDNIYINERAVAFTRYDYGEDAKLIPQTQHHTARRYDSNNESFDENRLIEFLVAEIEHRHTDLTAGYENWVKIGWSLKSHPEGERLFHRVSALNPDYRQAETARKWQQLGEAKTVSSGYFIGQCKQALDEQTYKECCRRVYQELK